MDKNWCRNRNVFLAITKEISVTQVHQERKYRKSVRGYFFDSHCIHSLMHTNRRNTDPPHIHTHRHTDTHTHRDIVVMSTYVTQCSPHNTILTCTPLGS